ncbi:hypothetical protein [Phocaeicola vulgatus]|uniref:hypothetical protein n=1 Tax=Phocaeicola vulgatus TaxID=821 RepID=UPI0032C05EEC
MKKLITFNMKIKTKEERLKAYLDSLSDKWKRCILILMLLVNMTAFGIAMKRAFTMTAFTPGQTERHFGSGSLTDTLRRVQIHSGQNVITIQQLIEKAGQDGRQK